MTAAPDFFSKIENDIPDFLSKVESLNTPEQDTVQAPDFFEIIEASNKPYTTPYDSPEYTKEQLKAMSPSERLEYAKQLSTEREYRQSKGFTKGTLSGLSLGLSERIPRLKQEEGDLLYGLGEFVGSYLPISKLYGFIGKPLVEFAAKSPVAREGLMALARMTGFGLTGASYEAGKGIAKEGEVPSIEELAKTGATWTAIDAGLQALGVGVAFNSAVQNIAKSEGITAKEVLGRLWDSTKNYIKVKFGRSVKPSEILPEDIEVLAEQAAKAEKEGLQGIVEVTHEKQPVEEVKIPKVETEPIEKPIAEDLSIQSDHQIETELDKAKSELSQYEELNGKEATQDRSKLIQRVNKLELEKYNRAKEKPEEIESFKTSKVTIPSTTEALKPFSEKGVIDERPILKEIMDLKEKLKAEKSRPRKEQITNEIREKVKELGQIRKQNKQQPLDKEFGKSDISTKGLRAQKKFILEKIDDALENPQDTNQITIDVPGDGIFRINNEPRILENARNKVAKEWPSTGFKDTKKLNELEETIGEPLKAPIQPGPEAAEEVSKKRQVPPRQTRPIQPNIAGKKQAVARSKIIDLFRTAFTDPIRVGKFKQKAAGIHKLWPKVTRLLKANDVETAAHEIGHNLHTTLYDADAKTPQEQAKNINDALRPYLNELKPLAHYEPFAMEGFAEFTRLYVTNPDVARELAPKFYAKFEADLEAQYPEMKNALLEAREYYDQYLQGRPQSRIRAQTSYGNDKGKIANLIDSVKKNLNLDNLKTQFLDDVYPAKRLVAEAFGIPLSEVENLKDEANLYRTLRVLKGAVGKGDVFVLHETFNAKTLDKINGSLKDILKQLPDEESYREFNDYLIARRSIEKHTQSIETGINLGDAIDVEKELRGKYGKLAKELDTYNDALLNYAKDAGLISNEQYQLIKRNNVMYAPFQKVMEPEKGGVASGGGQLQAGKPIKKMKGSTRDIIAPVESVLKNTYSIIINSEKNLAGQVLAKIAQKKGIGAYVEKIPTPIKLKGKIEGEQVAHKLAKSFHQMGMDDLIEYDDNGKPILREDIADALPELFLRFGAGQYPAGENIVTVFVNGKPTYYEVSPDIYEMWTKGIAPYTANLLTKLLRIPARTLRAGAILNPKFIQKNFIRDTWGSWLFTKYGKTVKDPAGLFMDTVYSPLAMMATAAGKGKLYVDWMKAGGSMSTMQSLDRDHVVQKLEEVRKGIKPHQVIKWLRAVAEISEEANRLSEFGKALKAESKTRLGAEIAAFAARDLSIDFAKMGLQAKALNQIIPFWNATVQGGDKLLRTLSNPEDRKNFLPRVLGFIVIPSLILAWLNKDDANVKEFYEEEKDFNFITKVGDNYLKIPVPFETGVLAHGLTQRMFNYFIQKDPEAFEKFMGSIIDAMLPNALPTFANPFIETWVNKNFFTGARIIPRSQEDLIAKYQYKNNTSTTARLLGRSMAYMLGQETRSKAASPAIIDHFITSWTGGLGRLMVNISDASLEHAGLGDKIYKPEQSVVERLGLDAFHAKYPRASTRSIEKFYDNYADATARQKSIKYAEKMDIGTEEEKEAAKQRFDKIYNYDTLKQAYKAMQLCQKEVNNIYNDPSIDDDTKKKLINDLYLQMIQFAKAANEDIRQHRLSHIDKN